MVYRSNKIKINLSLFIALSLPSPRRPFMPPHRSPPSSTSSSSLPSSQDALLSPSSTLSRFSSSSDDIEAPYSDTDDHQLSSEKPAHTANARNKWSASAHASQLHRRKRLLATVGLLAVLLIASAFFASSIISSNSAADIVRQANNTSFSNGDASNSAILDEHVDQGNEDVQSYSPYVLGEPTDKFRGEFIIPLLVAHGSPRFSFFVPS